jgi:hypothetical protein
MATFTNDKSGEMVTVPQSKAELLLMFEEAPNDHWLWFHLARYADRRAQDVSRSIMTEGIAFLSHCFLLAQANRQEGDKVIPGLQSPMIRIHYLGQRYKISISKPKPAWGRRQASKGGLLRIDTGDLAPIVDALPGSPVRFSNDPVGDERYFATLVNGKILGARTSFAPGAPEKPRTESEQGVVAGLSGNPAEFLARCSKDMDRCCYCNRPLEDARSKDVGYGATCAVRWGLPWGAGYTEEFPSFATLWMRSSPDDQRSIRALCQGIREECAKDAPDDSRVDLGWSMLRDALRDCGWPEGRLPYRPDRKVILCRS